MSRTALAARTLFCGLMMIAPAPALAQSPVDTAGWLITPTVALALDGDADASLAIAGALAHRLARGIALEGELGHVFNMAPSDADVDSSLTTVHGSLLYSIDTEYTLTPYVVGGLGFGKFSHQVTAPPASIDRTEIGFNVGGGAMLPVTDRAWVRGDLRFFKHIDDVPSVWRFGAAITLLVGP